jgi:hypothetical protein
VSEERRSAEQYQARRNALTQEDLENITSIFDKKIQNYHGDEHCRFIDIKVDDLMAMINAHKRFNAMMDDNRAIVRRYVLIVLLTGMSGLTVYGFWSKIADAVKRAISGQ